MDTVDRQTRSRIMSRIGSRDTQPELRVRQGLHARGFRFRLHRRDLPGKPDIVLPKHRAVILVHGCFWHGHGCPLFRYPRSRSAWWRAKIEGNRARDRRNRRALREEGWRVLEIWECALKGKMRLPGNMAIDLAATWLESDGVHAEIQGESHPAVSAGIQLRVGCSQSIP